MADSEKAKGLLDLLKSGAGQDSNLIHEQTLGFFLEEGFEEITFCNFKDINFSTHPSQR
ncbi:MAG: hypothetical protein ABIB71_05580 [Candidatus Woesearchaeota archaeon]